ncbi:MAG: replication-relaxation family protein [Candidatus Sungbacteria bacterium]|nr:replication-relaxation family protein [Candidatus Sungbacteria bacterium]
MANLHHDKPHLRYKRLWRVPKKHLPNIVLQEQDERIFAQLADYGMLDTKQLRLLNPSTNGAAGDRYFVDRVGLLFEHGYIHRLHRQYEREKPRKHVIYTAKDKDPAVGFPHIRHTMMINDFRIALTLALEKHPEARLALWKKDGEVYDRVAARNDRTGREELLTIKPDAFFIINYRGRDYPVCFEADRATLTQQSQNDWRDIVRKIAAYWHWRQQKRHTKALNIEHFRVATITISEQRRENMRHVVQEAAQQKSCKGLLPGIYLFGKEADYAIDRPESILQEIWLSAKDVDERRPHTGRRYSLLE